MKHMNLEEYIIAYEKAAKEEKQWRYRQIAIWLKELRELRGFTDFMINRCSELEKRLQELENEKAESA